MMHEDSPCPFESYGISCNTAIYIQWESVNDKALALIGLALGDQVIYHLDFDDTTHEMWDKMEHLFGNKIINSKVFLGQDFFKLNMKHEDSLHAHMNHMESLITQLAQ